MNEDCKEIIIKAMKKIDNDISYDPQAGSISTTIYPEDLRYAYVVENLMADYGIKDIEVVLNFDFDDSGEEFYLFGGFLKVDGEELEYQDIEDWEDLKDSLTENLYNYFVSQIEKRSGRSIDYLTYERNGLAEYILDSIYEGKNNINIDDAEYIGHSNDILSHVKVRIETIKKGLAENHYFDKINLNLSFELDGKKYNKTFKGDAFDVAVEAEEYLEKSFFN